VCPFFLTKEKSAFRLVLNGFCFFFYVSFVDSHGSGMGNAKDGLTKTTAAVCLFVLFWSVLFGFCCLFYSSFVYPLYLYTHPAYLTITQAQMVLID